MSEVLISFIVGVLSSAFFSAVALIWRHRQFRMSFRSVARMIDRLAERINDDNYNFDYIVTIGRNSGVAGSILAGNFGLQAPVSLSLEKVRRDNGARAMQLDDMSTHILRCLSGKRLLVFICCNDSGATMGYVVDEIEKLSPPPTEIRTAALYSVPASAFIPRYVAVTLGEDSRRNMTKILTSLPWATGHWKHPFIGERMTKRS